MSKYNITIPLDLNHKTIAVKVRFKHEFPHEIEDWHDPRYGRVDIVEIRVKLQKRGKCELRERFCLN
ncbi:hypothetical protein [Legionella israelensis]|uniref:hypothetical protein n=1 Tax=Legionella israelensis TaxID=454 RepID=UPI000730579A|nr:hypothetical protein [Legionella israelensis]QBS11231.1 hypothetical protein E4T55_15075 [Legionella israelensis]